MRAEKHVKHLIAIQNKDYTEMSKIPHASTFLEMFLLPFKAICTTFTLYQKHVLREVTLETCCNTEWLIFLDLSVRMHWSINPHSLVWIFYDDFTVSALTTESWSQQEYQTCFCHWAWSIAIKKKIFAKQKIRVEFTPNVTAGFQIFIFW